MFRPDQFNLIFINYPLKSLKSTREIDWLRLFFIVLKKWNSYEKWVFKILTALYNQPHSPGSTVIKVGGTLNDHRWLQNLSVTSYRNTMYPVYFYYHLIVFCKSWNDSNNIYFLTIHPKSHENLDVLIFYIMQFWLINFF